MATSGGGGLRFVVDVLCVGWADPGDEPLEEFLPLRSRLEVRRQVALLLEAILGDVCCNKLVISQLDQCIIDEGDLSL